MKGTVPTKEIRDNGKILAVIFPHTETDGVNFLTKPELPLQIGILNHEAGKTIELHKHRGVESKTDFANEWIYVEAGQIEVTVANNEWAEIETVTLNKGESILLISGAHKVVFHKGAQAIEVKQGPYPGADEAKIFKNENTG